MPIRIRFDNGVEVEAEGSEPLGPTERAELERTFDARIVETSLEEDRIEGGEAIAVIGMACRFPGAGSVEEYWNRLCVGREAISDLGNQRFDIEKYYDTELGKPGKTVSRRAGLLEGIEMFDAEFFGMSEREAEWLDPQQRLLLETAWTLLESAGYAGPSRERLQTGVFIGASHSEYLQLLWPVVHERPELMELYTSTGNNLGLIANRLSYQLDLTGPSVTIDTACSSSLVAVWEAVRSLQSGDCNAAVAGGVNLLLTPENFIAASRGGMLSADGRCKTFDERADGYVRSEGVGLVLLRRLSDARRDGDAIHAVLLGASVNQDGRSNGLTAPNGPAQTQLILDVWKRSGIDPSTIGLVEAHGTGTSLGDPIEVAALDEAFRSCGQPRQTVAISSVKPVLGHLESAAGIASLIKTILCLKHRTLPPTLHVEEPNRHIHFDETRVYINDRLRPWLGSGPLRAGVSAFGMGGTNAHCVVESASTAPSRMAAPGAQLFVLSAKTDRALRRLAQNMADSIAQGPCELADVCYTLAVGRAHFGQRLALVVNSCEHLVRELRRFAGGSADRDHPQGVPGSGSDRLATLARRYLSGESVDWLGEYSESVGRRVELPTYPFERRRYWLPQRRENESSASVAGRFLELTWHESLLSAPAQSVAGRWLVIDDDQARAETVAQALVAAGGYANTVLREDFRSGLARPSTDRGAIRGVVWFAPSRNGRESRVDRTVRVVEEFGRFVQALSRASPSIAEVFAVTECTGEAVGVDPQAEALRVLVEGASREFATTRFRFLGSNQNRDQDFAEVLVREMKGSRGDGASVYWDGRRMTPRIAECAIPPVGNPWKADGAYLVVGGFGDVGFAVARHFAKGGLRIALTSRHGASAERFQKARELESLGADVLVLQGDVTEPADVERWMREIRDRFGRLDGIVHAAGATPSCRIEMATRSEIEEAFHAKARGAENLLRYGGDVDRIILCSSASALHPEEGQGVYAAANAYVDALARSRATPSRAKVVSIAWGPWKGSRAAEAANYRRLMELQGVLALGEAEATTALDRLASADKSACAFLRLSEEKRRSLLAIHDQEEAKPPAATGEPGAGADITELVRRIIAQSLRTDPSRIDTRMAFRDLGLDSILAMEVCGTIRRVFRLSSLSPTAIFEHSTIDALARHLASQPIDIAATKCAIGPTGQPRRSGQDVAIIGLAARFPGAKNTEEFWRLLIEGREAIGPVPEGRLELARTLRSGIGEPSWQGGFLDGVDEFDPMFFRISGREAAEIDPRHRLFLQIAYHALENAGYGGDRLAGSRTGVYVAAGPSDYRNTADSEADEYWATACSTATLPSRFAYFLNLRGPCLPVDTACSSSLAAIHLAVRAIRAGEIDAALVGAVHLNLSLANYQAFERMGALSKDGHCRAFGAGASGFVPGEGVVAVLLKPLDKAVEDGDAVHGVILGSAMNNDGASNGLTAPNPVAQEEVLRAAWQDAGMTAADVDVIEGHGTGTSLGDPIELEAIDRAVRGQRTIPVWVGSVKSNIGHTEASAGLAGLVKVVLSLEHSTLPATLHVDRRNPHFDWSRGSVDVLEKARSWPRSDRRRIAGISAFGFGGTNVHVVVAEGNPVALGTTPLRQDPVVLVVSARTRESLREARRSLAAWLRGEGCRYALGDIAGTAALGRMHLPYRAAAWGTSHEELAAGIAGETGGTGVQGEASGEPPDVVDSGDVETLARGYVRGAKIAWSDHWKPSTFRPIPLPLYPFARERYWRKAIAGGEEGASGLFWRVEWQARERNAAEQLAINGQWLIVGAGSEPGLVSELSASLAAAGCHVSTVAGLQVESELRSRGEVDGIVYLATRHVPAGELKLENLANIEALLSAGQVLAERRSGKRVRVALVTRLAQPTGREKDLAVESAVLLGLARVLPAEVEGLSLVSVDLDERMSAAEAASKVVGEIRGGETGEIAYRDGVRMARQLVPGGDIPRTLGLEGRGGAYLITGGLGGIGLEIARWFLHRHGTRLVIVGRSRLESNAAARANYEDLRRFGEVEYIAADVSDPQQVEALFDRVGRRIGRLDGVVHAAGVIDDERLSLRAKSASSFSAVLAPKVAGSWNVAGELRRRYPGTWLLMLSSVSCLSGRLGAGQADYAAGSRFQHHLASWLRRHGLPRAQAILLSEWGRVGMLSRAAVGPAVRDLGLTPIDPATALSALEESLLRDVDHVVWLRTEPGRFQPELMICEGRKERGVDQVLARVEQEITAIPSSELTRFQEFLRRLDEASLNYMEATFAKGGLFRQAGERATREHIVAAIRSPVFYDRWLDGCIARLMESGRLARDGEEFWSLRAFQDDAGDEPLVSASDGMEGAEGLVLLVRRFGKQLLEVLRGSCDPVALLFPDGSMDELGKVHGEHIVAQTFAKLAQSVVKDFVNEWRSARLVQVLEVGAGTGGTTAGLLDGLPADRIEYTFSDVSAGFFRRAELRLASWRGPVSYCVLDLNQSPVEQGFGRHSFDVVIATNVVHATESIARSLTHLRELLAPGGILLLTELVESRPWIETTFGLTKGWWAFQDLKLRVRGPLLEEAAWRKVLAEYGFDLSAVSPSAGSMLSSFGQRVFVARAVGSSSTASANPGIPAGDPSKVARGVEEEEVIDWLSERLAGALRIPRDEVTPTRNFLELGVDSVLALQVRRDLEKALGVRLPATLLYEQPNAARLARYLWESHGEAIAQVLGPRIPDNRAAVERTEESERNAPDARISSMSSGKIGGSAIAIIGMASRFPGAGDVEAYWRNIREGKSSLGSMPPSRGRHGSAADERNTIGGFLDHIEDFAAGLFRITPHEARMMDPQQRLFLEASWEAIERAGYSPEGMAGRRCAVFAGVNANEYLPLLGETGDGLDPYAQSGNTASAVATRVSYFFDLRGPAITLDSACSSSLSAVYLAVEGIRSGQFEMALAGGVNVILRPSGTALVRECGMLSADNRCHTFDEKAQGFVRSEGLGVVLLKSLESALRDGDAIVAVIEGIAANNDGSAKAGMPAPSPSAQSEVIHSAIRDAGVSAEDIGLVEAHGTATSLGDPIELAGLCRAYRWTTNRRGFCAIGSVKSNIGHSESAAGIAGLIKAVLAVRHGVLPPTVLLEEPNRHIAFDETPFYVNDRARPWSSSRRLAGVSSFGFGGTNVHVLIGEAPPAEHRKVSKTRPPYLFVLSAETQEAVRQLVDRYRDWLGKNPELDLGDVAYTAAVGRHTFRSRVAIVARDLEQLRDRLEILSLSSNWNNLATSAVFIGDASDSDDERRGNVAAELRRVANESPEASSAVAAFCGDNAQPYAANSNEPTRDAASDADWANRLGWIGRLFVRGARIDWLALFRGERRRRVELPPYPFQRRRCWLRERTDVSASSKSTLGRGEGAQTRLTEEIEHTSSVDSLIHETIWTPKAVSHGGEGRWTGDWLILANRGPIGRLVAAELVERGATVVEICQPGARFGRAGDAWTVNPDSVADFRHLLAQTSGERPLTGVVHLWCYGDSGAGGPIPETVFELDEWVADGPRSLLLLASALARRTTGVDCTRLVAATTMGSVAGGIAKPRGERAALGAILRSVQMEGTSLDCRHVDLEGNDVAADVGRLMAELEIAEGEVECAYRGSERLVPELRPIDLVRVGRRELRLRRNGCYLITGGMGGIGLELARWLAVRYAAKLILVGTQPVPTGEAVGSPLVGRSVDEGTRRRIAAVEAIKGFGEVVMRAGNAADLESMRGVFEDGTKRFGRIDGVFHLAGRLRDGGVVGQGLAEFESVWQPKATGAWVLDRLTRFFPPDWMVFFSSTASVLGSAGQAAYAGANRYLDALAAARSREGLPTLSIQWGLWSGQGMALSVPEGSAARRILAPIPVPMGLSALPRALELEMACLAAARFCRGPSTPSYEERREEPEPPSLQAPALDQVVADLTGRIARLLEVPPDEIDPGDKLADLGMDSILVARLTRELEIQFGQPLSFTMLRDHPTVSALGEYLHGVAAVK